MSQERSEERSVCLSWTELWLVYCFKLFSLSFQISVVIRTKEETWNDPIVLNRNEILPIKISSYWFNLVYHFLLLVHILFINPVFTKTHLQFFLFDSSVAQSCPTLCNPMECSTLGFPVHHQLLEIVQTHVHVVSHVIQPSHPLSSPSLAFKLAQHQGLFQWVILLISIYFAKYWSFSFSISPSNEYSGLISFRMDWLDILAVQGTFESSPTPQFKSISSLALSFFYGPTLTSVHDYWKNHSFD